jgi:Flp pilus assembly protein TadG
LEFALIALPFFLLLFGIADIARYMLYSHGVSMMASEAARYMMVQVMAGHVVKDTDGCHKSSYVAAQVASAAPYLDQTNLNFCAWATTFTPAGGTLTHKVTITASYGSKFMFLGSQTLYGTAGVEF